MCDENTIADDEALLAAQGKTKLSRRQFTAVSGGAAVATMLPVTGLAEELVEEIAAAALTESEVTITTPDGEADAFFVHPAEGKHAAVLVWPDVIGLRDAYRLVGRRLAASGYSVLVVNPYYRSAKAPVVPAGASFRDEATRAVVLPMARSLTPATNVTDANAFVGWLDAQEAVDTSRKVGTTGYCMGGAMTMRTAAALPGRVGAGASFHGGRLVTDDLDSPHRLVPVMNAQFLIAVAENDDKRDPVAKSVLAQAFEAAELTAEIEVYEGAQHGWCTPDSAVHNEAQANRAWGRLLATFETALA